MNASEKLKIVESLSEDEFRKDVIIPLLSKMGFKAPIHYHGPGERGKDIICFDYDKLGEQRFLVITAKSTNLNSNAADDKGLMNIVTQVQQSFDIPYEDIYSMKQINIDEVWIMTSGKIVSGAEDSVIDSLRKYNLDKQIRFIRADRVVQLLDQYYPTYWNSNDETKESVIIQRDRLLKFIERILLASNTDKETIAAVKSNILYSDYDPSIRYDIENIYFSSVSSYSIEMGRLDKDYDDYIVSHEYGLTQEIFAEVKKN